MQRDKVEKIKEEFEDFNFDLSDIKLEKPSKNKKEVKKPIPKLKKIDAPEKSVNKVDFTQKTADNTPHTNIEQNRENIQKEQIKEAVKEEPAKNESLDEMEFDLNDIAVKNEMKSKGADEELEKKERSSNPILGLVKTFFKKEDTKGKVDLENENEDDIRYVNSVYSIANENVPFSVNTIFSIIVAVIISLIVWANIAQVDELTRGEGKVIPSSKLQNVQSFDGGIVSEILIKDGEHVTKGQPLMKIDTTRFQATFEENEEALLSLKAKKVRLEAELSTDYTKAMKELVYTNGLKENGESYIMNQKKVFRSKFLERQNTLKIIQLQEKQKKQELVEVIAKEEQLKDSLALMEEELETIEKMVKSGSKSKVELLQIKKEYNTLKGELRSVELSIPRTKLSIEESTAQINEKLQSFKSEISQELEKTLAEIKVTEAKMVSETDKLEKTVIKSPVDGTINQININTIGSVVKTGENLIEIVPDSENLLIEAKIDPKDIAFINPSSKALVKLTAYDFSIYGGLEGKIVEISADSIKDMDSKDNKSYYKVVVKTEKNYLEYRGEKLTIIPGMIAQVDIITGKKSIMDFFLKPILKVKDGAFHER